MISPQRVTTTPPLPPRPSNAHKGTFGRVVVVAGSEGMSGAACLAAYGALRGGAGLVTVAIPDCIAAIVAGVQPSWMTAPLPSDHGSLHADSIQSLTDLLANANAAAIGPGLGSTASIRTIVETLYREAPIPLVLDADALNVLAEGGGWDQPAVSTARVLTPHPGEFARLAGCDISEIQSQREELAVEFAARHQVVLLLKGAGTVITDGAKIAINTTGSSGMATGGSGDVLTGLIASLLAQGMSAFDAAQLAAHLHGLAGEAAARRCSPQAMTADDLQQHLGEAWKQMAQ